MLKCLEQLELGQSKARSIEILSELPHECGCPRTWVVFNWFCRHIRELNHKWNSRDSKLCSLRWATASKGLTYYAMAQSPLFFFLTYWKGRTTKKEAKRQRKKCLLATDSFPKWPQWTGLDQTKIRSYFMVFHMNAGAKEFGWPWLLSQAH